MDGATNIALADWPPERVLYGTSAAMQSIRRAIGRIAAVNVPVLIEGESGTGKEVFARTIHRLSPRKDRPFVRVNCPAVPASLVESELFGHERGSFTGAVSAKPGLTEMAHLGTLFLDEIAELEVAVQAKLLQLLQDGQFFRLGGQQERRVNLRVVCATNRDLGQAIQAGSFRRDLFYRINVFRLHLPPLRERREDIPSLVEYFLRLYSSKYSRTVPPIAPRGWELLMRHDWPGNIRELKNVIRSYVALGSEETIRNGLKGRPGRMAGAEITVEGNQSLKQATEKAVAAFEREIIQSVLKANDGNRRRAARALHISYRSLFYRIKAVGLPAKQTAAVLRGQ